MNIPIAFFVIGAGISLYWIVLGLYLLKKIFDKV